MLSQEGGIDKYDLSDLNINPKTDYLGFTIYYMNNDGPEQQLPLGYEEYAEYHVGIKGTIDWSKRVKIVRYRNNMPKPYHKAIKQYKIENWPTMVFDNYIR